MYAIHMGMFKNESNNEKEKKNEIRLKSTSTSDSKKFRRKVWQHDEKAPTTISG